MFDAIVLCKLLVESPLAFQGARHAYGLRIEDLELNHGGSAIVGFFISYAKGIEYNCSVIKQAPEPYPRRHAAWLSLPAAERAWRDTGLAR